MKAIFKFTLYSTYVPLEGIFVVEEDYVEYLINNSINLYFGEVDGKHSEIDETISKDNFIKITDDPKVVKMFEDNELETGINPFNCTKKIDLSEDGDMFDETWMDFFRRNYENK